MNSLHRLKLERPQRRCGRLAGFWRLQCGYIDAKDILAGVVDGNVLVWLKKADFADALRTNAAGGEVRDTAGRKLNANIGDIDLRGQDRKPNRMQLANRGLSPVENNVKIMNHEIEHDIDIERSGRENTEPMNLKK